MNYAQYLLLLAAILLGACGPKDIGNEVPDEEPIRTSISAAEQMRYPMFGSDANQRMLYLNNKMDTMVVRQNLIQNSSTRNGYISPEHPSYRAVPKQASPFRQ